MPALSINVVPFRWAACKVIGFAWRGAYLSRLSGLRLKHIPIPELPGPRWVRVRTHLGGICGTDLGLVMQRNHPATMLRPLVQFPVVLGHENVGTIESVGAAVQGWRPGQRVCVEPSLSCQARGLSPECPYCATGLTSLCERITDGDLPPGPMIGLNARTGGSWSPYFVAHESQLYAVPEGIDDETAILVDPLATSLHAVFRHRPADGDRVLVQGGGIIGVGVVAGLRALGSASHITALVRHAHQADLMKQYGADGIIRSRRGEPTARRYDDVAAAVGGRRFPSLFGNQALQGGFDVVYDCVGSGSGITDALKFTRPRGTMVAVGTSSIGTVDTTPLWFSELNVVGVSGRQMETSDSGALRHTYEIAFQLIGAGKLRTAGLLTHRFALCDYRQAFRALLTRTNKPAVKVVFDLSPA
jgi:threonine dehydrogenase-like Zn-dependent dehydrogenase